MRPSFPGSLVLLVSAAMATSAAAAEPVGTPQPSAGSPGDQPGRSDPFGTGGAAALTEQTPAERQAQGRTEIVDAILIQGNERVSDAGVLRRLAFRPGEVLTPDAVRASRARLFRTGAFSAVDVTAYPAAAPGRIVVVVQVEERYPVTLGAKAIAQTPVSRPYIGFEMGAPNLFGRTLAAAVAGAADLNGRWAARLTIYEPTLEARGRTWVVGVRGLVEDGMESACATPRCNGQFSAIPWLRYRRLAWESDAGFRPGRFSRFLVGYRFEALKAATDAGAVAEARPAMREGRSILSALVVGYDLDTRTDSFVPSGGWRFEVNATVATAVIGSDYEYSRYLLQAERWFGRPRGHALRLDAAVGLVQGDAPFFDRFYAADWSYFSIGLAAPRLLELNFSPDSRYDAFLAVAGMEWDVPLWSLRHRLLSRGILALGARVVVSTPQPAAARSLVSAVPISLDAAFRVRTRYGDFGIGLGYLLDQLIKALPLKIPAVERR